MSELPVLPLLPDGTLPALPLLARWLEAQRRAATSAITIPRLPPGNGSLPDLLAGCGIARVRLGDAALPAIFRWEGCGGGRVLVQPDGGAPDQAPLHHGHLPVASVPGDDEGGLDALIDLARLEDASALRALTRNADPGAAGGEPAHGAAWDHILAAAGAGAPPRIPPLAGRITSGGSRPGAWNPLPFARRLTVSLPLPRGTAPWGLADTRGARHPVQVVEGPLGRELLTSVRLGALEAVAFTPLFDPVAGCHWEVSRTVLDNGRVRAELDPLGQIVRLCCDGRFIDWSGPAVQPLIDGLPLGGTASTSVLEEGPVRARVVVSRVTPHGNLHLTYTLHAHEDQLRIAVGWDGEAELMLDHPTTLRAATLRLGGELCAWTLPQQANVTMPAMPLQTGVRWAVLAGGDGFGLSVSAPRTLALGAHAGRLQVRSGRSTLYALGEAAGRGANPALAGFALATPGRPYDGGRDLPAPWRLADARLTSCWARKPEGWDGELLLTEPLGHDGRTVLYLSAREAWRCAIDGEPLSALPPTPEGDGFEVAFSGGDAFSLRWR
jgi:hypothetical protein